MFSIKKLFGKDEKFYDLLEASAEETLTSTKLLSSYLQTCRSTNSSSHHDEIVETRRKDKGINRQINEELCKTFITPIEREDIDALAHALYRIPKMVEKLVQRLSIYPGRLPVAGFQGQAALLENASTTVVSMVKQLRKGARLSFIREENERLQQIEGEADKLMLDLLRDLYEGPYDAKETMILQELFELAEKAVDRCRDAGSIVFQITLKYS